MRGASPTLVGLQIPSSWLRIRGVVVRCKIQIWPSNGLCKGDDFGCRPRARASPQKGRQEVLSTEPLRPRYTPHHPDPFVILLQSPPAHFRNALSDERRTTLFCCAGQAGPRTRRWCGRIVVEEGGGLCTSCGIAGVRLAFFSIVTLIPLLTPPGVKSCGRRWVVSHLTSSALTSFLFSIHLPDLLATAFAHSTLSRLALLPLQHFRTKDQPKHPASHLHIPASSSSSAKAIPSSFPHTTLCFSSFLKIPILQEKHIQTRNYLEKKTETS